MSDETGVATSARGPVRLVVRSPDGRRVLARPNGLAGWALPTIAEERPFLQWSAATVARASAVVGASVWPVRPLGPDACEAMVTDRVPAAGTTWIGLDDVERLGADAGPARAVFETPPATEGHLRPGWITDLDAWIDARFARSGPTTLLCHWELSAVVSVPCENGTIVVKQNGPGFDREGPVVDALAGLPHAPEVLAVDHDIVATAWAGSEVTDTATIAAALGELQRSSVDRVDALRTAGCPLAADLARSAAGSAIDAHLSVVEGLGLPTTAVHADAHAGNVLVDGDRTTVIDWSDTVVGAPVLDLPMLILPGPHLDSGSVETVVQAWSSAFGVDDGPVLRALPSIRAVAYAVTVALYEIHDDLPASARPWWDDWTESWRHRLDESLSG